ncbi:hypothetical protein EWM64_g2883 [Hericium alpestre]|uniref:F-box domain-containing protein n=1 Tax=Hericium alpestre TaxID=135208 RepID=A0A4Z0A636_9AGAM|nr:hypothetical protein EWM64_g2883 [Hericium alpestre]
MSALLDLPTELIARILEELDFSSLIVCQLMQVCQKFRSIIQSSSPLQYAITLKASGMQDGPDGPLSSAERLSILKRHSQAWKTLTFSSTSSDDMPLGGLYELYGNVLVQSLGPREFHLKQLPSQIRGIEERNWNLRFNFDVRDFGMDPAQDLLFLLQTCGSPDGVMYIHVLSLTTGGVHPLAPNEAGIIEYPISSQNLGFAVQVHDDYFGVLIEPRRDEVQNELIILNWKTTAIEMVLNGLEVASFSFLSERHVVVTSLCDRSESYAAPILLVYDFKAMSPEPADPKDAPYVCQFFLPELDDHAVAAYMLIRSDPAPQWSPSPDLHVPFHIAHDHRLFVLSLLVIVRGDMEAFDCFIPSSTIMAFVKEAEEGGLSVDATWDEWGPTGSLLYRVPVQQPVFVCYVFGMRYVNKTCTEEPSEESWMVMSREGEARGHWRDNRKVSTSMPFIVKYMPLPEEVRVERDACMMIIPVDHRDSLALDVVILRKSRP